MKKTWFLKAFGISLVLLTALLFTADKVPAVTNSNTYIEFSNIGMPAANAKYLRWEIKATLAYDVVVYMVDDDGSTFPLTFSTTDATNGYTVSSASYIDNIGTSYFSTSPSTATFTANLNNLMNTFFILGGTHAFTAGNSQARVSKVRIYGDNFTLYSICIANNSSYSSPGWEINSSDFGGWTSVTNFKNNDGNLSDTTTIDFQSSYLHVTKAVVVVDPYTGYQIDPSTGLPYGYTTATSGYPTTGYQIDPYTGLPVGYPASYAGTSYPYGTTYPYGATTAGASTPYYDPSTGQVVYYDPATGQYRPAASTSGYPTANPYAAYPYTATSANPYAASGYPYAATSANPYATSAYPYGTTTQAPYGTTAAGYGQQQSYYPTTGAGYNPNIMPYSPYPGNTAASGGYNPNSAYYGQQYPGNYAASLGMMNSGLGLGMNSALGLGMNAGLGLGGINPLMGLGGGYPPMGLPFPSSGMNMGMGFDSFGFGLGLTGLGAFDPLSIAALAKGYPGLGMMGMGGLGLF